MKGQEVREVEEKIRRMEGISEEVNKGGSE